MIAMRIVKLASSSSPLLISARFTGRIIVFVVLATMESVNAADRAMDMRDPKEVIQNVHLSTDRVVVVPGDLFEISFKIKNPTQQSVTIRIGHLVEPQDVADYLLSSADFFCR
jgi:cytochrome c oxidase assembly protein Cox11